MGTPMSDRGWRFAKAKYDEQVMLYTERHAFAKMGPRRQMLHSALRVLYRTFEPDHQWLRHLWRLYRRTWPR